MVHISVFLSSFHNRKLVHLPSQQLFAYATAILNSSSSWCQTCFMLVSPRSGTSGSNFTTSQTTAATSCDKLNRSKQPRGLPSHGVSASVKLSGQGWWMTTPTLASFFVLSMTKVTSFRCARDGFCMALYCFVVLEQEMSIRCLGKTKAVLFELNVVL